MKLTKNDVCSVGGKVGIYNEENHLITFPDGTTTSEDPDLVLRMAAEDMPVQVQDIDLPVLEYGKTGLFVWVMQALLTWHRHTVKLDGAFGLQTLNALREFRKQYYLEGDTVCDRETWKQLFTE